MMMMLLFLMIMVVMFLIMMMVMFDFDFDVSLLTFISANNARCDSYHSDHLVSTTEMVSRFKSQKNEPLWHVL